jgi:hypothetical protein
VVDLGPFILPVLGVIHVLVHENGVVFPFVLKHVIAIPEPSIPDQPSVETLADTAL